MKKLFLCAPMIVHPPDRQTERGVPQPHSILTDPPSVPSVSNKVPLLTQQKRKEPPDTTSRDNLRQERLPAFISAIWGFSCQKSNTDCGCWAHDKARSSYTRKMQAPHCSSALREGWQQPVKKSCFCRLPTSVTQIGTSFFPNQCLVQEFINIRYKRLCKVPFKRKK